MIDLKITVTHRGSMQKWFSKLLEGLKGPKGVKVGFPKGKASADLISIAVWNHEGTSRGIPPRRFITAGIFKARGKIRSQLRTIAKSVVTLKLSMRSGLARVGLAGQDAIQQQIASNMPPPNAPSTVAQKGSSSTLIDTGRLRQSATWDYDTK